MTTANSAIEIGSVVGGKYKVLEVLGQGGMGTVYRVSQIFMNVEMALKLLDMQMVSDSVHMSRFQREAKAASNLHHPNVIAMHDFGLLDSGQPYIVMEYAKGITLDDYLRQVGPIPLESASKLFSQICLGVAAAHDKRIIHRDIKPKNIILREDALEGRTGSAKIIDFGIAKVAPEAGSGNVTATQTDAVIGSPAYMSPEQCGGKDVDHRTDIYSLGCVLFEILTGTPPYIGETTLRTMMMHQSDSIPTLREASLKKSFPEPVERVVAKMLAKQPGARYADVESAAKDFAIAATGSDQIIASGLEEQRKRELDEPKLKVPTTPTYSLFQIAFALGLASLISASVTSAAIVWQLDPNRSKVPDGPSVDQRRLKSTAKELYGLMTILPAKDRDRIKQKLNNLDSDRMAQTWKDSTNIADNLPRTEGIAPTAARTASDNTLQDQSIVQPIKARLVTEDGQQKREFIFPEEEVGELSGIIFRPWQTEKFDRVLARGRVVVPALVPLAFCVDSTKNKDMSHRFNVLRAISKDAFYGLDFHGSYSVNMEGEDDAFLGEHPAVFNELLKVGAKWNHLEVLRVSYIQLTKEDCAQINSIPDLKGLVLSQVGILPNARNNLDFFKRVEYMDLDDMDVPDLIYGLKCAKKLRSLTLNKMDFRPGEFAFLADLPSLTTLKLKHVGLNHEVVNLIATNPNLKEVELQHCGISAEELELILQSKNIESIRLDMDGQDMIRRHKIHDPRITH